MTVVKAFSVEVSPPAVRIDVGGQLQMSAAVLDERGETLPSVVVDWSSTAPSVASVDANGLLVAHAAGWVEVHATAGGISGAATVAVVEPTP